MKLTNTHKIVFWILVIVLVIGLCIFIYGKLKKDANSLNTTTPNSIATSTGIVNGIQGSGYKIEQVPITEGRGPQPVPDLSRPIIVSSGAITSPEGTALASQKIPLLQSALKKNTLDLPSWLDLAMYQKMAGDYVGASLSWGYAGKLAPTSPVSFSNLGNLYAYFLKDTTRAETYYKEAITKDPKQIYLYIQLGEMYRDVEHNVVKAKAVADQGLAQIPNDPNLLQFKATLQ